MNSSAQSSKLSAPVIHHNSWRFGDLAAADLLPCLQRHLLAQDKTANWQIVWLNNGGRALIGLLPKTSWQVHLNKIDSEQIIHNTGSYQVTKSYRGSTFNSAFDSATVSSSAMSYHTWQNELIAYSESYTSLCSVENREPPHYSNGLIGFIGYDIAAHNLSPSAHIEQAAQPCAVLAHYDIYLTLDSDQQQWTLIHHLEDNISLISQLSDCLTALDAKLSHRSKSTPLVAPLCLQKRWQKSDYQRAFDKTQRYLYQGDGYQINLTQAWLGQFDSKASHQGLLLSYLPDLHRDTQAPFAGYMRVHCSHNHSDLNSQNDTFELLSCSPELFFTFIKDHKNGTHHIRTKPIKGTMPRGSTIKQDDRLKQQLVNSDKDRSENVMIVDLLRNDLGKYAKTGSVKVPQLFDIESFSNVHHMVSTITAELNPDTHPLAVLFGSLPAGSITGTPKKRAVEIISELETMPRGAYCGTMGYMNFDGSGQWNVLIRTLQAMTIKSSGITENYHTKVSLWAGGGITVASTVAAEYQECLDKVSNLLAVLAQN